MMPIDAADLKLDVEAMIAAALAAGDVVMQTFGTDMAVQHKSPDQPLTAADLAADRLLRGRLLDARPTYGWLSEETADNPARLDLDRVWVVDPIDGTRSFIAHRPEFSISVALAVHGEAAGGVIYNPATRELYWAARGMGAWQRLPDDSAAGAAGAGSSGDDRAIRASIPGSERVIVASRSEIARGEFEMFADWTIDPLGSTAYKMVRVAAGEADAFLSRGPKSEWDVCAGVVILEEAGAVVSDARGGRLTFNRPDPVVEGVLAGTVAAHGVLLPMVLNTLRGDGL